MLNAFSIHWTPFILNSEKCKVLIDLASNNKFKIAFEHQSIWMRFGVIWHMSSNLALDRLFATKYLYEVSFYSSSATKMKYRRILLLKEEFSCNFQQLNLHLGNYEKQCKHRFRFRFIEFWRLFIYRYLYRYSDTIICIGSNCE